MVKAETRTSVSRKVKHTANVLPAMVTRSTPRARLVKPAVESWTHRKELPRRVCESCRSSFTRTFQCPCGHRYCRACLREMFRTGLADRSMLPIRCCGQAVDSSWSRVVMNAKEFNLFEAAMEERDARRYMYCPSRSCSWFINFDRMDLGGRTAFSCPGCAARLCSACATAHPDMTCAQYQQLPADAKNPEDAQFRVLVHQKRYVRCPRCERYIEHAGGCSHMVCRCGASFTFRYQVPPDAAVQA